MATFDNSSFYNRGRRTNHKQKQMLIAAMAKNRSILECRSQDSAARLEREAVWTNVMLELNKAGPEKNFTEWRKVWTDLRLGMRKKWEKAQKSEYILTEYERRVIKACGMIQKSGDEEDSDEKNSEDIHSFLAFLKKEEMNDHENVQKHSQYFEEDVSNSVSDYFINSSEYIICQPNDIIDIKEECIEEKPNFAEYEEPSIECISDDDEPIIRSEEFRDLSVECISDEEEFISADKMKIECSTHSQFEEPHLKETVPRPIQLQCPEMPSASVQSLHSNNINLPRRKKLKDATLKEIRKMHRNLLRGSKKQTALLRILVQGMQH